MPWISPIRRFESAFAEYQGAACARSFWMGRVGLYAVLKALGVRPGDGVGICTFTCLGVIESITRLGAKPVFLDVDRHMNIAPAALQRNTQPMRVLVLQHTFGVPCDLEPCLAWARERKIPVVEDSCHALGAEYRETKIGNFGVASIFSMQFGKPLIAGQGGIVTFTDGRLAEKVDDIIAKEGLKPRLHHAASLGLQRFIFNWFVRPATRRAMKQAYDLACRMGIITGSGSASPTLEGGSEGFLRLCSNGQARAGRAALRRYPKLMDRRIDTALYLSRRLADEGFNVEPAPAGTLPVYLRLPVWVEGKRQILEAAQREHVDIAGWYETPGHPLRGQALLDLGYNPSRCPTAEAAFARVVTLPTHPRLSEQQLDRTIRVLRAGTVALDID